MAAVSRTTYDEALLDRLADRANAGEEVRALAEEHGFSYKPLYLALLRRGKFHRRHHRWWTRSEINDAWRRVSVLNETVASVAARMGVSDDALRHVFSKNGLHIRDHRTGSVPKVTENQRIYAMRAAGMAYKDIGVALGYPDDDRTMGRIHMRLRRYCERAKIPVPPRTVKRRSARREPPAESSDPTPLH